MATQWSSGAQALSFCSNNLIVISILRFASWSQDGCCNSTYRSRQDEEKMKELAQRLCFLANSAPSEKGSWKAPSSDLRILIICALIYL